MKNVIHFILKGLLKNKYTFMLPLLIISLVLSLLIININLSGATQKELQDTFKNRKSTVSFLITKALSKEKQFGLTSEQQQSLTSLLSQEEYLKVILNKLKNDDLHISLEHQAYINAYQEYVNLGSIPYNNQNVIDTEQYKVEELLEHDLTYTEQINPFKTALFTKQLFQILFSPMTLFLFILIFCYKYQADREGRTFDFFKVNSLSHVSIYYGYLIPLLMAVLLYIIISCFLSLLPPLITGNINTIYYPIEVTAGSEIIMVPTWKWLIFIPIGWGISITLLYLVAICLFKQRAPLGLLFLFISAPLLVAYMISLQFGFHMANPIHLILSYETNLLPTQRFIRYLFGMLFMLFLCFIISYPIIKAKDISLYFPPLNINKKQYQMKKKWKLFRFEHVKKRRKGHVFLTIILLFAIISGTFAFVNQQFLSIPTKSLKMIEDFQIATVENRTHWEVLEDEFEMENEMRIRSLQQTDEKVETSEENPYTTIIKKLNSQFQLLESLKKEINSPIFPETLRKTMKSLDFPTYKEIDQTLWTVTIMASEEQQNIIDAKGMTAWPIGHQWVSHFHDPSNALDSNQEKLLKLSKERNTKYGNSSLFSIYKYLGWNIMLLVFAIFVMVLWTTLSEEYKPNASIHFITTKPIRFNFIYVTKWIYNLVISLWLLLVSGTFVFLLNAFIGGFGETEYPILTYATEKTKDTFFYSPVDNTYFYFENLLTLLIKSGVLIFTQIFFLNSLFCLIGRWMKHHYATIVLTLMITIIGYFIGHHYIAMDGNFLNPFVYFDTWNIVDGWKSIEAQNDKVNFINGSIILLIGGGILFCIGLLPKKMGVLLWYYRSINLRKSTKIGKS